MVKQLHHRGNKKPPDSSGGFLVKIYKVF